MTQPNSMHAVPLRRIRAIDGMAVTADVWEEAHDYHRRHQELHALLSHGPGILTGLDVVASDPPDTSVYIRPGAAIDPNGRMIVLKEPLTYDLSGGMDGRLYLLLSYGESHPRVDDNQVQEGAPLYIQSEFGLEITLELPAGPHVELARLWRQGRGAAISDAAQPHMPGRNEIDLRFRRSIGAASQAVVAPAASVAVVHLGGSAAHHGRGAQALARALRGASGRPVWVDDGIRVTDGLDGYTLVYLVGHAAFQLTAEEVARLHRYWQGGGTLFVESCRRDPAQGAAAEAAFGSLLQTLGVSLADLQPGHALLEAPALFSAAPPGYETGGSPRVRVGEGVVFSTCDYGCLWQAEQRGGPAPREAIRAAHELGGNLVALAEARRGRAGRA